jgi:hypothetical protein
LYTTNSFKLAKSIWEKCAQSTPNGSLKLLLISTKKVADVNWAKSKKRKSWNRYSTSTKIQMLGDPREEGVDGKLIN